MAKKGKEKQEGRKRVENSEQKMWNEIFFLTNPTRFSNVGLFFSILFPRRTCHRKIDLLSRNRFPPDRVCSYQYSWRNENCQAWPYYAAWPGLDAAGCCNGDALCAHTTINIGCARARPRTSVARGPHNAKLTRARAHMRVQHTKPKQAAGSFVRENSRRNLE